MKTNALSKIRPLSCLCLAMGLVAACGYDAAPNGATAATTTPPETAPGEPAPEDPAPEDTVHCGQACDDLLPVSPPDDELVCGPSQDICDGVCVDLSSDADNCGACGAGCGEQSCSDAICNAHVASTRVVATLFATATDVALTSDGSAIVVGSFAGTMELIGPEIIEALGVDGYVAKVTKDGGLVWLAPIVSTDELRPTRVAVGPGDVVAVGGAFSGKADIGADVLESVALEDAFVAMFDADGGSIWGVHATPDAGRHHRRTQAEAAESAAISTYVQKGDGAA